MDGNQRVRVDGFRKRKKWSRQELEWRVERDDEDIDGVCRRTYKGYKEMLSVRKTGTATTMQFP